MRVAMYLRKSRADIEAEARGEGETLAKHKKYLLEISKRMNLSISKIYNELVSGERIYDRPQVQKLLQEVSDGQWDAVMVMEVDRLARGDTVDQGMIAQAFKDSNTKIITPQKTYDPNNEFDEEYFEFGLFMSRREYKVITRRLQRGRIGSVKEGNYIGTRPPYGYEVYNDDKGRTLRPHPDQAQAVKLIFEWYANGRMGSNKIANELNRLPYKTYTGKPWEPSVILNILKNEVYIGLIQWRKREYKRSKVPGKRREARTRDKSEWISEKGRHEALIDIETFQLAQDRLKRKYHPPYQLVNGLTNPLAGLIKCGKCGASMVLRPYANQPGHIKCYNSQCDNRSSRMSFVEESILTSLSDWLVQYELKWDMPPEEREQIDIEAQSLAHLQSEKTRINKQKDRLHDLLESGAYDLETFLDRSQKLVKQLEEVDKMIDQVSRSVEAQKSKDKLKSDIIPKVKSLIEFYQTLTSPVEKNEILKSVIDRAVYTKEKHQRLSDFTLDLHVKF